jgi:hypothetical protein
VKSADRRPAASDDRLLGVAFGLGLGLLDELLEGNLFTGRG